MVERQVAIYKRGVNYLYVLFMVHDSSSCADRLVQSGGDWIIDERLRPPRHDPTSEQPGLVETRRRLETGRLQEG